jgi:hypothetical protein
MLSGAHDGVSSIVKYSVDRPPSTIERCSSHDRRISYSSPGGHPVVLRPPHRRRRVGSLPSAVDRWVIGPRGERGEPNVVGFSGAVETLLQLQFSNFHLTGIEKDEGTVSQARLGFMTGGPSHWLLFSSVQGG